MSEAGNTGRLAPDGSEFGRDPGWIQVRGAPVPATWRPFETAEAEDLMPDEKPKPSEVDAVPGSGVPKPESPEPGKVPKLSEVDAQPDSQKPDDQAAG